MDRSGDEKIHQEVGDHDEEDLYLLFLDFEQGLMDCILFSRELGSLRQNYLRRYRALTRSEFDDMLQRLGRDTREREIAKWQMGIQLWLRACVEEQQTLRKKCLEFGFPEEVEEYVARLIITSEAPRLSL